MLKHEKYPGLLYDHIQGSFWRLKLDSVGNLQQDRRLFPNEEGNISYFCAATRKPVKRKASVLAWEILYNCSARDLYILHRDLDESNLKGSNLFALNRKEYIRYKDCLSNVQGAIRLHPHPTDAFSYIVYHRRGNKLKQNTFKDIVSALRFKKKMLLFSLKVLGRYLNTE
jgi:hypothetical protein